MRGRRPASRFVSQRSSDRSPSPDVVCPLISAFCPLPLERR